MCSPSLRRGDRLPRGAPEILAMLDQFGAERAHGAVLLDRIACGT
jgi:hypothetical protein